MIIEQLINEIFVTVLVTILGKITKWFIQRIKQKKFTILRKTTKWFIQRIKQKKSRISNQNLNIIEYIYVFTYTCEGFTMNKFQQKTWINILDKQKSEIYKQKKYRGKISPR